MTRFALELGLEHPRYVDDHGMDGHDHFDSLRNNEVIRSVPMQ